MAVDGPALLGAAIRAACLAKAPRRTVQAVASAVTGVLVGRPHASGASPPSTRRPPRDTRGPESDEDLGDPAELLEALRASRRARRKRKKDRRREAKAAAAPHGPTNTPSLRAGGKSPRGAVVARHDAFGHAPPTAVEERTDTAEEFQQDLELCIGLHLIPTLESNTRSLTSSDGLITSGEDLPIGTDIGHGEAAATTVASAASASVPPRLLTDSPRTSSPMALDSEPPAVISSAASSASGAATPSSQRPIWSQARRNKGLADHRSARHPYSR